MSEETVTENSDLPDWASEQLKRWNSLAFRTLPPTKCDRDNVAAVEKRIADLEAENDRLENLLAEGVHTCSQTCKRPMCVLRREKATLEQQLAEAQKQCIRLKKFRDNCVSLTGSLWPQNETTEYLSELLNGQDGVVMFEGDCDGS